MKYENFKQAKGLVEQIDKHYETLGHLDGEVTVVILPDYSAKLYTIGTGKDSEHEYSDQAGALVGFIISDLTNRIEMLKGMLDLL